MAQIFPGRWLMKPPVSACINWGHPLAAGLQNCYLLNEAGGLLLRDIAGGNHLTIAGTTTKIGSSANVRTGTSLNLTLPTAFRATWRTNPVFTDTFTIEVWCFSDTSQNFPGVFLTSSQNGFFVECGAGSGGNSVQYYDDSAGGTLRLNVGTQALNVWQHIVVTSSSSGMTGYINGVLAGTGTAPSTITATLPFDDNAGDCLLGNFDLFRIWNRTLNAAAVQSLYLDPYGMILAQSPHLKQWIGFSAVTAKLFRVPDLAGIGSGGPFSRIPLTSP